MNASSAVGNFISRASFVLLLVCTLAALLFGNDGPQDAAELIAGARQQQLIRSEGNPPVALKFQLTLDSPSKTMLGVSELLWESPAKWREEIQAPASKRLRTGASAGFYQFREPDNVNEFYVIYDKLTRISDLLQIGDGEVAGRIQERKINGIRLTCVEIQRKSAAARKLCFDRQSGTLNRAEFFLGARHTLESLDYSDFRVVEGKQFPFTMSYHLEESLASMKVVILGASSLKDQDPHLFAPVEHSQFWSDCEGGVAPERLTSYPLPARTSPGSVLAQGIIETDGSVSHLKVLRSSFPGLEASALDAIGRWTYKPRMCHGVPMRAETTIEIVF